jgi:hypothetical protein
MSFSRWRHVAPGRIEVASLDGARPGGKPQECGRGEQSVARDGKED